MFEYLLDRVADVATATIAGVIVMVITRMVDKRKPPKGTGKHFKGGKE